MVHGFNSHEIIYQIQNKMLEKLHLINITTKEQKTIAVTWQDSKLSKITLEEGMGTINDKSYIGKEVYLVDFETKSQSVPDNMIVYIFRLSIKCHENGLGINCTRDIKKDTI